MPFMRKIVLWLLSVALLLEQPLAVGALARVPADEPAPGLVILVEGIGGLDVVGKSAEVAFRKAGLSHQVHHFVWTHGTGKFLRDLQDTQHLVKKAEELAAFIRDYRARYPQRPIYVVGKSAGSAIVLYALQTLPPGTVERVLLLSPAVSPSFDLRRALLATRQQMVAFYSRNDRMVLGWGTSQFGTADRYYGKSAGLIGFVVPAPTTPDERALYARLVQIPWSTRLLREGNTGGHSSTSTPWFVTAEVVPWLR